MFVDRGVMRQRGVTLIETIIFMIMVSVGVIGLVSVMNPLIRASADPMITKQMVAIAESLLNEILHQPYTWCDPEDANAATAQAYTGATGCLSNPQSALGATPNTETRNGGGASGEFFDNVRDYAGFAMDDVADPAGGSVITGYRAEVAIADVAIAQAGAGAGGPTDPASEITVTVCRTGTPAPCAGRESFSLTGYRFRYAPRY